MALSTVPAVLAALVDLVSDEADSETEVLYGQPDHEVEGDVIVIAFTGVPNEAAVEDTRSVEEITRERDRERYEITCLASSWPGSDTDLKAVTERAFDLLDLVGTVCAKDQTLGRTCMRARVGFAALAPTQTQDGAVATIQFRVSVDAFTGRP